MRALPVKLKDEFPARLIQGPGNTPDMGPGAEVWSWRGMGVSTALWDLVRASLRSGIHKDAVLGIIHSVAQGLPDEPWVMQPPIEMEKSEEIGGGEDAEGVDNNDADGVTNGDEEQPMEDDPNKEVCVLPFGSDFI